MKESSYKRYLNASGRKSSPRSGPMSRLEYHLLTAIIFVAQIQQVTTDFLASSLVLRQAGNRLRYLLGSE